MNEPYRIVLETDDMDLYMVALRALKENEGDMKITMNLAAPTKHNLVVPVEVLVRVAEVHVRYSNGAIEIFRTPAEAAAVPT
jgi:hypothetical protein